MDGGVGVLYRRCISLNDCRANLWLNSSLDTYKSNLDDSAAQVRSPFFIFQPRLAMLRAPTIRLPGITCNDACKVGLQDGRRTDCRRRGSADSVSPLLETLSTVASDDRNGTKSPVPRMNPRCISMLDLKIVECVCQGQFAIYRAVDPNTKTQVALKKCFGENEQEQYLEQEIDVLRQLSPHPNIVHLLGYMPQALATRFCAGGNLARRLHDRPRKHVMTADEAVHLARHMCFAFCHIHSHGFVHRDLKSGNLLLSAGRADLTTDTLLVNDFGLSARQGDAWREAGTLRYSAPEVVDKAAAHSRADVWAMGCVFIELFGGILPYHECESAGQVMAQIVVECAGPEIPDTLLVPLHHLISRMISRDPELRPTIEEVLSSIESTSEK